MMSDLVDSAGESLPKSWQTATEHVKQLQRLQEKDPDFYKYLKENDKELLEFNDEDITEDEVSDLEDVDSKLTAEKLQTRGPKVITTTNVDTWCTAIKEKRSLGAIRSMLRAFRTACHHGDDAEDGSGQKFTILSSSVFNKIMVFVLNEMDGVLRKLLEAPSTGGKRETILDLMTTKAWKTHGSLMRLYLGNALQILNEMTDEQMISFTLKRIKASAVFLVAFPALLRKYIRVVLHTWGTGTGALPVVSFLFLRDLCVRLGSDCLDSCLKGVYKAYVMNCKLPKHISRSKLQHINFLGNCISELYGLDPISAYQHAFVSIRQLSMVLRGAINERGPQKVVKGKKKGKNQHESSKLSKKQVEKTYQKVYDWQFLFCLELWTKVICAYNSEADFGPLAYPLTQIISGVASLVPSARYFPLRLRCIKMLNRIAGATGTFIPVNTLLLGMLDMKELNGSPTGGVGKAVDMHSVKQLDKLTLKTRAFQEACIHVVVEELAEHLAQWSYSVAFFELSFIPLVRLRSFCKSTKVDRFRREIRELIHELEANCDFTLSRRNGIGLSPSDLAATSLEVDKKSKDSPLLQFVANLRLRVQQRAGSIVESSVLVGSESSVFATEFSEADQQAYEGDEEEGAAAFSSSWMPDKKSKSTKQKPKLLKKHEGEHEHNRALDNEDVVEDLVLSSDEDNNDAYGHDEAMITNYSPEKSFDGQESHESKTKKIKKRKRRYLPTQNKKKEMAGDKSKRKNRPVRKGAK
ncbi:hypothetical protein M5K25_027135 [Dendrobium thyrsiflorum]|uniref:Nucleolar complex protein 2-like protein n=1 Tax=Dendrobium thyrsiflorum TaxID=117978 RepID=A0ABD0TZ91_DENTH